MHRFRNILLITLCLFSLANCRRGGGMMGGGGPMEGAGPCGRCNPGPQGGAPFERERLNGFNDAAPFPTEPNIDPNLQGNPIQIGGAPIVQDQGLFEENGPTVPPVSMGEISATPAPALPETVEEQSKDPSLDSILPDRAVSSEKPTHK